MNEDINTENGKKFIKTSFILEKNDVCFSLKRDAIYNHSQNNLKIGISAPFRNTSAYRFCHRAVKEIHHHPLVNLPPPGKSPG